MFLGILALVTAKPLYVCEAGDAKYVGVYEEGSKMDGVSTYTNANDMSLFRSKGFWYVGNLGPWPPETHFRCVNGENCHMDDESPPIEDLTGWTANKKFATGEMPVFSSTPCSQEEL